jgi:signal transduction histidine kinase
LITFIGVPLFAIKLYVARFFADVHRTSIGAVTRRPAPRPRYVRPDGGWFRRSLTPIRDGQSWLDLLAGIVDFPFAIFAFVVATVWWSIALGGVTSALWEWSIPHGPDDHSLAWVFHISDTHRNRVIVYIVLGVFCTLTLPYVVRGAALLRAYVSRALLCGVAEMRQRIGELQESNAGLAQSNAGLAAQKQAAVSAEATALRRLERDIHDGPQQRLVRLAMDLGRARQQLDNDPDAARAAIDEALGQARDTLDELRALSRGIAPPVLADRGLPSALAALAGRSQVPVDLAVAADLGRLDPVVENTLYFVTAEALTNVAKHSQATTCTVTVAGGEGRVGVLIVDDGGGGAHVAKGHGLAGLDDRVRAAGGTLAITSPTGGPTEIRAEIPCG